MTGQDMHSAGGRQEPSGSYRDTVKEIRRDLREDNPAKVVAWLDGWRRSAERGEADLVGQVLENIDASLAPRHDVAFERWVEGRLLGGEDDIARVAIGVAASSLESEGGVNPNAGRFLDFATFVQALNRDGNPLTTMLGIEIRGAWASGSKVVLMDGESPERQSFLELYSARKGELEPGAHGLFHFQDAYCLISPTDTAQVALTHWVREHHDLTSPQTERDRLLEGALIALAVDVPAPRLPRWSPESAE